MSVSLSSTITYLLRYILAALQVMVTVWKNLRFHNGHDAVLRGREQRRMLGAA